MFAGYEVNTGMKWGRKMLVWSLEVMSTLTLAFDMEKVPLRATDPHVTEVVIPVEPFEFPLKEPYERTNGTIEGLRNRDSPEIEDEEEEGKDDGDENDGDDGGNALAKTNLFAPENWWLGDNPFLLGRKAYFQGL